MPANRVSFLHHPYFLPFLLIAVNLVILAQNILLEPKAFVPDGQLYTRYNNYLIFKNSFFHLLHDTNLYTLYHSEHFDLFKYSPTFALLMAPFAILPDYVGLLAWNLLNTFVFYFALRQFPGLSTQSKTWIMLFCLFELITSLRNLQSNALIAGMLVFSFGYLERGKTGLAILLIIGSAFIKLFGIVALVLLVFYPGKLKSAAYCLFWATTLALLPAALISFQDLLQQYQNWWEMLKNDHSISLGLSVMGWLQSWFGAWGLSYKREIPMIGALLLCIPLLRISQYKYFLFRVLLCCSVLLWVVIFNHRAESPTFIIAAIGIGIWYFIQPQTITNRILMVLAFVFTILSATDLFPRYLREHLVVPFVLKAVPCIFIWFEITIRLMRYRGIGVTDSRIIGSLQEE